jgi:hypothetical protein
LSEQFLKANETEPSCRMIHIYLEIPAEEASEEDQLSVDSLQSLFQPLIACLRSTRTIGASQPEPPENMKLSIGLRRGTSFDGPYDGLVGVLMWRGFEILDFPDGPSGPPDVLYKETI